MLHYLAIAFWLLLTAIFALIAVLQFSLCQQQANRGNLAGLLWEFVLFITAVSLTHWAWPF